MKREDYPNPHEVRTNAREEWEDQQKDRRSRIERITSTLDLWVVVFATVFILLSIPHTVVVFNIITPWLGYTAFIGLEFFLLYYATRSKIIRHRKQHAENSDDVKALPVVLHFLALIVFVSLVIANGAGAFMNIADRKDIKASLQLAESEQLSLADLQSHWGDFSAKTQIALLLAPFAALIIPLGTVAGGDALASLFLDVRTSDDPLDEQWRDVQLDIEFAALRDEAMVYGATAKQARKWASEVLGLDTPRPVSSGQTPDRKRTRRKAAPKVNKKDAIFAYLDDHGDDQSSVREFAETVSTLAGVEISKTYADSKREEWRVNQNGHGGQDDE